MVEDAMIGEIHCMIRAPEITARTIRAQRRAGAPVEEAAVVATLVGFERLWGALYPAEQARIVQLLVERITVSTKASRLICARKGSAWSCGTCCCPRKMRLLHEASQALGRCYEEPVLVPYSGATRSGCGAAQAEVGPFYCPAYQRVCIYLDFMGRLLRQLGALRDFAAAYIVAHEIGHQIQNEFSVLEKLEGLKRRVDQRTANELQVRVELQADCLAGLWAKCAHDARRILEAGDIEEGLRAAAAVGDDTLQRKSQGYVQPETFTHGSSDQRLRWFRHGLDTGQLSACDTFQPGSL
jgi:hypothetical protein